MALPDTRKTPTKRIDDAQLDRLARLRAQRPPDDDAVVKPTDEGRARADAERLDRARAETAARDQRQPPGDTQKEDKGRAEGDDDISYLARLRAAQAQEREAQADERASSKASQVQSTRAKAGAAGLGLSGASAGQEATVIRQADRANNMAEAGLEQRFRDEEYDSFGRQGAIMDYEDVYGVDIDGDGYTSGSKNDGINNDGNPDNDMPEAPKGTDLEKRKLADANEILPGADYSWWDGEGQPGSVEVPYEYQGTQRGLEAMIKETAPGALPLKRIVMSRGPGAGDIVIWVDQYGNHYTIVSDNGRQSRREREVAERDQ